MSGLPGNTLTILKTEGVNSTYSISFGASKSAITAAVVGFSVSKQYRMGIHIRSEKNVKSNY